MKELSVSEIKHLAETNTTLKARLWLSASYIYYLKPDENSCFSDYEFDQWSKDLLEHYDELTVGVLCQDGNRNEPLSNIITKTLAFSGNRV